ncbi:MAG: tetratricopeptide repeat protein, partial [Verrucomicrobiota bacterium]|nr:tetratricopeptide repeat protein [Verrucomicrobiota bacterium]
MKIRKIAAITVLVLSSFAANNVAPTKAELEAMYDKAFREFDSNNFPEALKDLDAIDARQPDLAESQNLRGVILMREGIYDKAEAALHEALRIDPKFWNARFNLAEIPFLQKNWAEARNRFQELLSNNVSELQGEASQLIQYKILLTYLLEGKENMVDSILAKFELSPDTPAVHYANAAISLQHKNAKEAKDWMVAAEKNFSPQLNKLFAESLYEVGWLEKQTGQGRAALELTTAAEKTAKSKAFARSRFEQAQQAFQQRDFATARKFVDEADAAEPNQAVTSNLRGEILMEQKEFDEAEAAFKKALKTDPKFRQAQYNLAQIPFKKKDYVKARERFESLFSQTPGGDKNQAAQLLKFKIYMTLLLEGRDSRAQKMMEQFQFTGDTPALYYAQAAWEFKHNNPNKATDWITSAKKIYSPALNGVFADAFYDLGWMQSPAMAGSPAPASQTAAVMSAQTEPSPAIEPSPIPGASVVASGKLAKESPAPAIAGMEATTSQAGESPAVVASNAVIAAGTPARPEDVPAVVAPALSPTVETPVAAPSPSVAEVVAEKSAIPATSAPPVVAAASATPATALAPARVREWSRPTVGGMFDRWIDFRSFLVAALVLAGIVLFAWGIVPEVRRRVSSLPVYRHVAPAAGPALDVPSAEHILRNELTGGPRQVSLQLKASEPSLRRSVRPLGKPTRPSEVVSPVIPAAIPTSVHRVAEPEFELAPMADVVFDSSSVGPVVEQGLTTPVAVTRTDEISVPSVEEIPEMPTPVKLTASIPAVAEMAKEQVSQPAIEPEFEPIGQGQPIPYQMSVAEIDSSATEIREPEPEQKASVFRGDLAPDLPVAGVGALRESVETPAFVPEVVSTEPSIQLTTPATMPEPVQIPTAQVIRTPATGGAPQPASAMQTAVQLTFSFEIASMQLTPSFKMGALQLRPSSKIVTMRLAPSQHPQPAMNLQVTFEIAKIQPSGGGLGTVRLTPSQQQRPTAVGSPSFTVAGLQLVSNFEAAPVQLTPSQQASVLVTGSFQIATVEFSPSFEIASIVLNASSKQVSVQLPGAAAVEGAPVFDI